MKSCSYPNCEEEESLPFKCGLCGQQYCAKHRLPEQHDCPRISVYQTDEYRKAKVSSGVPRRELEDKKKKKESQKRFYTDRDIEQKSMYIEPKDRFLTRSPLFSIFSFKRDFFNTLFATFYICVILVLNSLVEIAWNANSSLSVNFLWTLLTVFVAIIIIYGGHQLIQNYVARKQDILNGNVLWWQGIFIGIFGIIVPIILIPSYLIFRNIDIDKRKQGITALSGIIWILFWQVLIILTLWFQFLNPLILIGLQNIPLFMLFFVMFSLIPFGINHGKYISLWKRKLVWILLASTVALFIAYLVLFSGIGTQG